MGRVTAPLLLDYLLKLKLKPPAKGGKAGENVNECSVSDDSIPEVNKASEHEGKVRIEGYK